jgi:hypothetical protein
VTTRRGGGDQPELSDVLETVGAIAHDAGRLVQQQFDLLRAELRQELVQLERGVGAMGAGAVLAASGGALSTLALVHGLRRATGLPLWACYALVGGSLGLAGAGLILHGRRRIAALQLAPQSSEALAENLQWLGHQISGETT